MHEILTAAVAGSSGRATLQLIADRARELVAADIATFARPAPNVGTLVIDVVSGTATEGLLAHEFSTAGSVSRR